jgi:hypothetical protein
MKAISPGRHKSGSHLAVLNPGADNEIIYWFLAAWNKGEIGIKKDRDFASLVLSEAERIMHPLTVTLIPGEQPPTKEPS